MDVWVCVGALCGSPLPLREGVTRVTLRTAASWSLLGRTLMVTRSLLLATVRMWSSSLRSRVLGVVMNPMDSLVWVPPLDSLVWVSFPHS